MSNYNLRQEISKKETSYNKLLIEAIAIATFVQLAIYGAVQYEKHGESIKDFAQNTLSGIERFLNK